MLKTILFLAIAILVNVSFAQSNKQIQKAIKTYNKSANKGISKLEKYIEKAPNFGNNKGWETLIKMEYSQYSQFKEMFELMTIEVENEEADDSTNAATAFEMKASYLNNNEQSFLNVCRKAAVMSTSALADFYLRKLSIDFEPDTLISDTAMAYFKEGEAFYIKEDYELAKLNYRKAISVDNDYYKAVLYLGDAFWREEKFDSAIYYFSIAKALEPELLEPRKFLIDALMGKELLVRAKEECLDAFCVFPSYAIKYRYMDILKQENKWMYTRNIKRDFFANNMADTTQGNLLAPYDSYRKEKNVNANQYNMDGINTSTSETFLRYLEVNSWREFLKENENDLPDLFRFAQKMNKEEYLDCYVLFSFFHADIYPQYKDFMRQEINREKMKYFIRTFLISEY